MAMENALFLLSSDQFGTRQQHIWGRKDPLVKVGRASSINNSNNLNPFYFYQPRSGRSYRGCWGDGTFGLFGLLV